MSAFMRRMELHVEDFLRTRNVAGIVATASFFPSYINSSLLGKLKSIVRFSQYYPYSSLNKILVSKARKISKEYMRGVELQKEINLSIGGMVVKPYISEYEPGAILVKFEHELEKIATLKSLPKLEKQYKILFFPSWQPFYSVPLSLLEARLTNQICVMPADFAESSICTEYSDKFHHLPFHSASWVRGDIYGPPAQEKTIDLLMVANFARYKRHWKLFEALADLPKGLNVVLAGIAREKRTREVLLGEARLFGVEDRITIVEGASDHPHKRQQGKPTIRQLLSQSRLFCALTHKEGTFNTVSEALMAGTPVAMFKNAKIGTKAYINEKTGFLFNPKKSLSSQIDIALKKADNLNPQEWAKSNISAEANCRKMNDELSSWYKQQGLQWTKDIEPFFCQHLDFRYFNSQGDEELNGEYKRLKDLFGVNIERK